jgi:maleylpyruvate isomerase
MTLRLFNYFRSSASYRVRIALHFKSLPFEYVPVHLMKDGGEQHGAAHRERNPMEQVPTLEIELGGQRRMIAQSMAILELLEELHPTPALLPKDPFLRARARELAEAVNAGIQPHQNLAIRQRLEAIEVGLGARSARHHNEVGLSALEARVKETAGRFCIGDSPTFPDLFLVPQLFSARGLEIDVDRQYPTLARIDRACAELPAFAAAHPSKQPDAT